MLPPNFPGTVELVAGEYYPIRIVYTNANLAGSVGLQVTLPDGITSQDFSSSVFSYVNSISSVCVETNTSTEDPTSTSSIETSTETETSSSSEIETSSSLTSSEIPITTEADISTRTGDHTSTSSIETSSDTEISSSFTSSEIQVTIASESSSASESSNTGTSTQESISKKNVSPSLSWTDTLSSFISIDETLLSSTYCATTIGSIRSLTPSGHYHFQSSLQTNTSISSMNASPQKTVSNTPVVSSILPKKLKSSETKSSPLFTDFPGTEAVKLHSSILSLFSSTPRSSDTLSITTKAPALSDGQVRSSSDYSWSSFWEPSSIASNTTNSSPPQPYRTLPYQPLSQVLSGRSIPSTYTKTINNEFYTYKNVISSALNTESNGVSRDITATFTLKQGSTSHPILYTQLVTTDFDFEATRGQIKTTTVISVRSISTDLDINKIPTLTDTFGSESVTTLVPSQTYVASKSKITTNNTSISPQIITSCVDNFCNTFEVYRNLESSTFSTAPSSRISLSKTTNIPVSETPNINPHTLTATALSTFENSAPKVYLPSFTIFFTLSFWAHCIF